MYAGAVRRFTSPMEHSASRRDVPRCRSLAPARLCDPISGPPSTTWMADEELLDAGRKGRPRATDGGATPEGSCLQARLPMVPVSWWRSKFVAGAAATRRVRSILRRDHGSAKNQQAASPPSARPELLSRPRPGGGSRPMYAYLVRRWTTPLPETSAPPTPPPCSSRHRAPPPGRCED